MLKKKVKIFLLINLKKGLLMQRPFESETVVNIPLNNDQMKMFEKINSEARGIDFEVLEDTAMNEDGNETLTVSMPKTDLMAGFMVSPMYYEIKNQIKTFEKEITDEYEVCITPANYSSISKARLVTVLAYQSGAISLICEDNEGEPIKLFDHIDSLSFALTKSSKLSNPKEYRKVSFIFEGAEE